MNYIELELALKKINPQKQIIQCEIVSDNGVVVGGALESIKELNSKTVRLCFEPLDYGLLKVNQPEN